MKLKKYATFVLVLIAATLYAQDPNIIWQRTIGGADFDGIKSMAQTSDGGYILGGISRSNISGEKTEDAIGAFDYWVIKLDSNHSIEWQNTIGGTGDDRLNSISQTADGGYIIGGLSTSNASGDKSENCLGFSDYWVVKLNASGTIEWENTIGGGSVGSDDSESLESVAETTDGGYILGGWSESNTSGDKTEDSKGFQDYWVVKLNTSGTIEWQNTIGGDRGEFLNHIVQTTDGGYILGGKSSSDISGDKTEDSIGFDDYWVVKLNSSGNIAWQNTIGGDNSLSSEVLETVIQTNDGGYLLGGSSSADISGDKTENSQGLRDFWVIKLNSSGTIAWQNTIGGNNLDFLKSLFQTSDGGYILGGYSNSDISGDKTENSNGGNDYWIIKINTTGFIESQNTIGGNDNDRLFSLFQDNDTNFVLGGFSPSDISGDKTESSRGSSDFWILKLNSTLGLSENKISRSLTLYPNPAKNTLQLNADNQQIDQVKIFSVKGDLVQQVEGFETSKTIDVSKLASGMYYVQFTAGRQIATKKFIKQ